MTFADRSDAGRQLADELLERGIEADVVLAIPRGALPVGRAVADALGVPLDIVVARKMGAPSNPELAIGAVASDGSAWLNDGVIADLGVDDDYVREERRLQAENARHKADRYREGPGPELVGRRVLVVDDGVATGATVRACVEQLRNADAAWIGLAVPVGSPRAIEDLRGEVDELVCLETPVEFRAVGQFYREFGQVTDEEAVEYLNY